MNSKTDTRADDPFDGVSENFYIPQNIGALFRPLSSRVKLANASEQEISESFEANLRSVVSVLGLPFSFALGEVYRTTLSLTVIEERIKSDSSQAVEIAAKRVEELFETKYQELLAPRIAKLLSDFGSSRESSHPEKELLRQGLVLVWSTFEVFCRDLFVSRLNGDAGLAQLLFQDHAARKRLGVEKIDLETLSGYGFDLSKRMGDILIRRVDMDDISTIRDGFGAIHADCPKLQQLLAEDSLWQLFQRRNLIVHRRGVIDDFFVAKTGYGGSVGSPLEVSSSEIRLYLEAAIGAGAELICPSKLVPSN